MACFGSWVKEPTQNQQKKEQWLTQKNRKIDKKRKKEERQNKKNPQSPLIPRNHQNTHTHTHTHTHTRKTNQEEEEEEEEEETQKPPKRHEATITPPIQKKNTWKPTPQDKA